MEELADAIEDAQYVNAIATQDDGPRPVLPWEKPTEEELAAWEAELQEMWQEHHPDNNKLLQPFSMEWTCQQHIGFFLFSQFIKEIFDDYPRINFVEEVLRFRKLQGKTARLEKSVAIANDFLGRKGHPLKNTTTVTVIGGGPEHGGGGENNSDNSAHAEQQQPDKPVSEDTAATSDPTTVTTFSWPVPRRTEIEEYDLARGRYRHQHELTDFSLIGPARKANNGKKTARSCSTASTTATAAKLCTDGMTEQELEKMYSVNMDYPVCEYSIVGLKGPLQQEILETIQEMAQVYKLRSQFSKTDSNLVMQEAQLSSTSMSDILGGGGEHDSTTTITSPSNAIEAARHARYQAAMDSLSARSMMNLSTTSLDNNNKPTAAAAASTTEEEDANKQANDNDDDDDVPKMPGLSRAATSVVVSQKSTRNIADGKLELRPDLFDKAEHVVMESLRRNYWDDFVQSEHFVKLKNFLWYQDRRVVPDDFFVMRVLGRGGFGLVTACKKGTSGKLYAMKVMNKRRIKMKKSELLALNERKALAAVESKFVINLKYSFHSKDDVFLILDLMTGGDLGFHLHQRGRFSKKECLYYAARIMLGLQALHDEQYVYRDLKPENCLLADDGRVKITDLGLATKITPHLHGAAGTRGYWAPEMLRRDSRGKRMPYGHAVDWFSFGCCVAEFIAGTNPFRSDAALKFGLECGKQTKEKAIDAATLEMNPEFPPEKFEPEAADLCRRLLDKNEKTRLGRNGCEEIMAHPWFKNVSWESIISDRKRPPFIPATDVNAASQSEIGTFAEDKTYQETVITSSDEEVYKDWDWTNPRAFAAEVIEFLIYERVTGEPLVPITQHATCCCNIL